MEQQTLFYEDIYAAFHVCVAALGGNKKVGCQLWPDKPADQAANLLRQCLDRARPEKLDLEQTIWVMREARKVGCHAAMWFIADECHYEQPQPIEPENEQAKLQRAFIQSVETQKRILEQMERISGLQVDNKIRAVGK